jgi:transcriptional regulator with XRE-family HTH domain
MSVRRAEAGDAVVGTNIRVHRLARRMSQSALAGALGLSFQQLQKYESGANRVGAARLVRIAAALHVPVTALLEGVAQGKGDAPSPVALIAHRHPLRLIQAFAGIKDKRLRLALIALTEGIARAAWGA